MRFEKCHALVCAALLVAIGATCASAAPMFYSTVAGRAADLRSGTESSYNALEYGVDSLGPRTAEVPSAIAWSSVTDTALRAYAQTDGDANSATASAGFLDTLMITSESMADGELARFFAEIDLSYTVTGGTCLSLVQGSVDGPTGQGRLVASDGAGDCAAADYTIYEPFVGIVGQEFTINLYLTASVGAFSPGRADAANTLRLFLTPLDDFTYTTASGHSYLRASTPVPEPATISVCGLGMGLIALRVRRIYRPPGRSSRRSGQA